MVSLKKALLLGTFFGALSACAATSEVSDHPQLSYGTPEEAVKAIVEASRVDNKSALLDILGPDGEKLIYSGDPVADKEGQQRFLAAYDAFHSLEAEAADKDILVVGAEEWPMPIPLVRTNDGWKFNTYAGAQAILDRRIGRNELSVIEVCRQYVEAQYEYAYLHKRKYGFSEYAQRIASTPGRHDGLYWPAAASEEESPFGPLMADAQAEGYESLPGRHTPYHGYYFRILHTQGDNAAGGEKDYVVNDHMTHGFGLIAYPAAYGDSGLKTFIVNQTGIVYEADLGSDSQTIASQIRKYDPDDNWQPVR